MKNYITKCTKCGCEIVDPKLLNYPKWLKNNCPNCNTLINKPKFRIINIEIQEK